MPGSPRVTGRVHKGTPGVTTDPDVTELPATAVGVPAPGRAGGVAAGMSDLGPAPAADSTPSFVPTAASRVP